MGKKPSVREGQAILRRYGIAPIWGRENLTWAPMRVTGQHGIEALQHVVDQLKRVEAQGGNRDQMVKMLQKLGKLAAQRR